MQLPWEQNKLLRITIPYNKIFEESKYLIFINRLWNANHFSNSTFVKSDIVDIDVYLTTLPISYTGRV